MKILYSSFSAYHLAHFGVFIIAQDERGRKYVYWGSCDSDVSEPEAIKYIMAHGQRTEFESWVALFNQLRGQ